MSRKTTKSKSTVESKTVPEGYGKVRLGRKDVHKRLVKLCSDHDIKNKKSFIKALYEEIGSRELTLEAYYPTKKEKIRYLNKLENQCRTLLDTILEGQNPEQGIRSTRAWELGINRTSLVQLEAVLKKLRSNIEEARTPHRLKPLEMSPSEIKALWRCFIATDIHRVFDQFNIPAKHHEDSAYYVCIKIVLASMDAEIDSVRSFMQNCRRLTGMKQFYKPDDEKMEWIIR